MIARPNPACKAGLAGRAPDIRSSADVSLSLRRGHPYEFLITFLIEYSSCDLISDRVYRMRGDCFTWAADRQEILP
jgi:hypothetical protein